MIGQAKPPRRTGGRRTGGLARDRRGIIAIMIALLAIPLICIIGLGIDYGLAVRAQALLDSAADAAAVAATDTASNAANNADTSLAEIYAQGQAAGTQMFNAQAANIPNVSNPPPVAVVTVTQPVAGTATFATTVTYTAQYQTWFGSLFSSFRSAPFIGPNTPTFYLSGSSSAQITLRAYEDFHILMDTSGSMSIAATTTDMANLARLTLIASNQAWQGQPPYNTGPTSPSGINSYMGVGSQNCSQANNGNPPYLCGAAQSATVGCAFGCHWDNSTHACNNCDFYEIAKNARIDLRVDKEQQAVAQVLSTMATQDSFNQYRAAVYGFSTIYNTFNGATSIQGNLKTVSALPATASLAALQAASVAAQNMLQPVVGTDKSPPPPGSVSQPEPNTNFGAAMNSLVDLIPAPGDGTTATTPQEFLFVITDGMEDFCTGVSGTASCNNRTIQPVQANECAAMKAKGIQIYILYVQYVPLDQGTYYNPFYVNDQLPSGGVQSFVDPDGTPASEATAPVVTGLQACATQPSNLFFASDSTQIQTQLNQMLLAAESQGVRLTQ
jgi:Flp pilus assembly protein TadG